MTSLEAARTAANDTSHTGYFGGHVGRQTADTWTHVGGASASSNPQTWAELEHAAADGRDNPRRPAVLLSDAIRGQLRHPSDKPRGTPIHPSDSHSSITGDTQTCSLCQTAILATPGATPAGAAPLTCQQCGEAGSRVEAAEGTARQCVLSWSRHVTTGGVTAQVTLLSFQNLG